MLTFSPFQRLYSDSKTFEFQNAPSLTYIYSARGRLHSTYAVFFFSVIHGLIAGLRSDVSFWNMDNLTAVGFIHKCLFNLKNI